MSGAFGRCHPLVNFFYFAAVIAGAMVLLHPVFLGVSLACSIAYAVRLGGGRAVRMLLVYLLPMAVVAMLVNPAFNHEGATILTYLRSGNPLTLESILFGIAAAGMLVSVLCWFSCVNTVITSDKLVYLFGRMIPALSLILSMVLRFVPRFEAQLRVVRAAQKSAGRDVTDGGILQRIKNGLRILSILISWSLENSVETADSMKSRGYGLKGRSNFTVYRFSRRDAVCLAAVLLCLAYLVAGGLGGALKFWYFPVLSPVLTTPYSVSLYGVYLLLCVIPLLLDGKEALTWKHIRSKI